MSKEKAKRDRNPDGTFAPGNACSVKYKDEYADMLYEFFNKPLSRIEYEKEYDKDGNVKRERPIEMIEDFPTFGMFARHIGVSVSAVKAWAGITEDGNYRHARFALAYACVREWAEGMMESGGITGKLNANMVKFVLENDYGKKSNDASAGITLNVTLPDEIAEECE